MTLIFIDAQVGIKKEIKQHEKNKKRDGALLCEKFQKFVNFGTVFEIQHILTYKIYVINLKKRVFQKL